jgi:hypothetical protein
VPLKAVIFAGPSLPPGLRPADPALVWRPPARQGELHRAALTRPAIIGLVDGYFEVTPTVWHKEILWAMAQGMHVYGSASTGALRAVELAPFGMKGVGRIYEAFRDGILEDDDEVAVLHGPEELGYPALTEAMVNIRAILDKAVAERLLDTQLAARLTELGKSLFYKKRSWKNILRLAADDELPKAPLDQFTRWRPDGQLDQKRIDALEMLAAIRAHLADGVSPLEISYTLEETATWQRAARRGRICAI